jgi:hypothetical protein
MNAFWQTALETTMERSGALAGATVPRGDVARWLGQYREDAPTSSNQGSSGVAFQRWFAFKEAFSPKFVADTLSDLPYRAETCLDPFGGSGTSAVTSRMLGLSSVTVEVNPFLADLIEAKLTPVSAASFLADYEFLISNLTLTDEDATAAPGMPGTFVEPGVGGRYVFATEVYSTARAIVRLAAKLRPDHERLLKVLLGSVLVANSNVIINGKGRRYRKGWQQRTRTAGDLIRALDLSVDRAVEDVTLFAGLTTGTHEVIRGDARSALRHVEHADVAVLSPPYPNSFDYTDVYNLELWMLSYLKSRDDNRTLRQQTLRSHVQLKWNPGLGTSTSSTLKKTVHELQSVRGDLWNANIPEMIGYYFDDLCEIFVELARILGRNRRAIVAIGDSQYAGVHVDVATILIECVKPLGFQLIERGAIRSMRTSAQHGGHFDLSEHCLVFERA